MKMKFKIKHHKNKRFKKLTNKKIIKLKLNKKMSKINKMRNKIKIRTQTDTYNNRTHTSMDKSIILIIKMKRMLAMSLFSLIEICD